MRQQTDFMDSVLAADLVAELQTLTADTQLSGTIDYHRFTGGAAPTVSDTGALTSPFTTVSAVPAFVGLVSAKAVSMSNGRLEYGDRAALVQSAQLTGTLKEADQVTYGGARHEVVMLKTDQTDIGAIVIYFRKIGGA